VTDKARSRLRYKERNGGTCPAPGCDRRLTPGARTCSEHGPWARTEDGIIARRNEMLDEVTAALEDKMRRDALSASACERAILASAGLPVAKAVRSGGMNLLVQIMKPTKRGLPRRERFDAVLEWLDLGEPEKARLGREWDACAQGLNLGARVKLGLAVPERRLCKLPGCTSNVSTAEAEYCSRGHAYEDRRAGRPKEAFARFLYDEWRASGKSQRAFAIWLSLEPSTLSLLLNARIATVHPDTAENLRAVFGERMPDPLPPAEVRRAGSRRSVALPNVSAAPNKQWRERMSEIVSERTAGPEWREQVEALRRYAVSETGRLDRAMGHELRHWAESAGLLYREGSLRDPVTGNECRPTNKELAEMARRIAYRRGRDRNEVLALLRPMLDRRSLWKGAVRQVKTRRVPATERALRAPDIELVRAALRTRLVLSRAEVAALFNVNRSAAYLNRLRDFMIGQRVLEVATVKAAVSGRVIETWALPGCSPRPGQVVPCRSDDQSRGRTFL